MDMSAVPEIHHAEKRPFTRGQLAKLYGVSHMIVKRACWNDRIPYFKIGVEYRIRYDDAFSPAVREPLMRSANWHRTLNHQRVYFIGSDQGPIKIGKAYKPEQRIKELQTGHPYPLRVLAEVKGAGAQEAAYHAQFAAHRLHGEWFERHPDILAEIDRLNERPARQASSEALTTR